LKETELFLKIDRDRLALGGLPLFCWGSCGADWKSADRMVFGLDGFAASAAFSARLKGRVYPASGFSGSSQRRSASRLGSFGHRIRVSAGLQPLLLTWC